MALLEIACFRPESAAVAASAGADRIELCANQAAGGISPPLEWLHRVRAEVRLPVFVMVRFRGGDFHYSEAEYEEMLAQVDAYRPHADGFVFGLLDGNRKVDIARTRMLVQRAAPLPCTFHRAFDEAADVMQALDDVVATGCRAILSSGGATDAATGSDMLIRFVERARGRIEIIAGGGVRVSNIEHIHSTTRVAVCHSSALTAGSSLPDASEIQQMKRIISGACNTNDRVPTSAKER